MFAHIEKKTIVVKRSHEITVIRVSELTRNIPRWQSIQHVPDELGKGHSTVTIYEIRIVIIRE